MLIALVMHKMHVALLFRQYVPSRMATTKESRPCQQFKDIQPELTKTEKLQGIL